MVLARLRVRQSIGLRQARVGCRITQRDLVTTRLTMTGTTGRRVKLSYEKTSSTNQGGSDDAVVTFEVFWSGLFGKGI